jgi:methyl-accepting chemotaxis protein
MEQTSGIEQVNEAIGKMDQVVQQNAALVEQAAAAAASLEDQASNLSQVVSIFKLDDSSLAPLPQPVAPSAARAVVKAAVKGAAAPARLAAAKPAVKKVTASAGSDDAWEEF